VSAFDQLRAAREEGAILGPMQRAGAGESFTEGIDNAVRAARQAVQAVAERPVAIAGSIGATPWGAPQAGGTAGLRDGYARQVDLLAESGVDVIALEMVTEDVAAGLEMLAPLWSGAVGVYPHHGRWRRPHWGFVDVDPDQLVELARTWVHLKAGMLGGCCGLRIRHVAALRAAVAAGAFA
jgi:methionine synthase I (cobalamin-dependent)